MNYSREVAHEIAGHHGLPKLMTLDELCKYAGCSKRHVQEEIKRKNLKAYKPVRELFFSPTDVEIWLRRKVK